MRDLQALLRATGGWRRFALLILLRSPFDALHTLVRAVYLQAAFNAIQRGDARGLGISCAVFGIGSLLLFLYNGTVWTLYATHTVRWIGTVRRKLFAHIASLPLAQIEAQPSGSWITRLNADVQAAAALLSQPLHLPHAVCGMVNLAVSSLVLVCIRPAIWGLVALFVVPHLLISRFVIARPMTALAESAQQITAQNTADLDALITCADTAILYDAQDYLLERFRRSSLALRRANMRMRRRSACGAGLYTLLGLSGYLLVLLLGGAWIAAGALTFGDLTAAFQYRGGMIMGAVMLTNSLINCRAALAGVRRVNETMQLPKEGL
mgnify:CR=1 FL=1